MDTLFNYLEWLPATMILVGSSLVIGLIYTFLISLKIRATKGFFITSILMPVVITAIIALMSKFLSGTSNEAARIVTIAVALGLIRFRSMNAKAEELLILFATVAIGLLTGLGYLVFAALLALLIAGVYLLLSSIHVFENKRFSKERLLKVTIPENLEYSEVFSSTFSHYLKNSNLVEVKTTAMGSLFRLSYKIEFKDIKEEKEFIDELRTKNGNLEISILPYVGEDKAL